MGQFFQKAKGAFPSKTATQNVQTLSNLPTAYKIAIDFMCRGNGFLTPGITLKLVWHQLNPEAPINEALPDKVVPVFRGALLLGAKILLPCKGRCHLSQHPKLGYSQQYRGQVGSVSDPKRELRVQVRVFDFLTAFQMRICPGRPTIFQSGVRPGDGFSFR